MPLEVIFALIVTLPIVAFITAFVWYINLGGTWSALKKSGRHNRTAGPSRLTEEA